jgi:outer membrane receptor for ferrienterochelin and colicins
MTRYSLIRKVDILALALSATISGLVQAQDSAQDTSTVVYQADYFAEYAPVTAQDMMDRIPGMSASSGGNGPGGVRGGPSNSRGSGGGGAGGRRGLGDGGGGNQILINGKRTAGKNNQASTQLNRIAAGQVDYIEIIRGTSGDLDVRGSGQVINVVLFEDLSTSSLSYEAMTAYTWDHEANPGGALSYSGQAESLDYLLSAKAEPNHRYTLTKENSILGDFSPNDLVREERIQDQPGYELSMNVDYAINDRSSARFNALYGLNDSDADVDRWTTNLKVKPEQTLQVREDDYVDRDNWELGGDYELNLDNGGRFKILSILNESNDDGLRERYKVINSTTQSKDLFLNTVARNTERIVRGSYTMNLFDGQDLEAGMERAQTILDSKLRLATDSAKGTASAEFGGLIPVPVSNANSEVEEIRIERFVVHNWQLNPRMSLESTLKYETSEIKQSGDVSNKRDFNFVKPKLDYRFNVTPALQLRGTIEKTVSQLSFRDFVAASDINDNDSNVQAGNVQLRQEEAWEYDANVEYRLPDDAGVVDASVFYHDMENVIERVDVSSSPTRLESANGNIGDGKRYGFRANASLRMGMIGLPNILTTSRFTLQDSEVTDPFLGIKRRTDSFVRGSFETGFRHDVPSLNLNYGLSWNNRFDGNRKRYDIEDIELEAGDPLWDAFVEVVAFNGITFRLETARDLLAGMRCRERQRFVGHIKNNILEEIEDNCSTSGRSLTLRINGTF